MDAPKNATLPPAIYMNFPRGRAPAVRALPRLRAGPGAAGGCASGLLAGHHAVHAKATLAALAESVRRFEERFGEIPATEPSARPVAEVAKAGSESSGGRSRRASNA